MSIILHPQKSFTVVRQIANHLDTDVNYVRAVIRNAYTDTILDTLDLTDKGGQRFSRNWQVPADSSGEGFYISIVTSVYSDSGYTTKNVNYGDEENTYLVEDKANALRGGNGGVDSRTIRRIISEELDARKVEPPEVELPETVDTPEEPPRWDEVLFAIEELKTALKPEAPEKVDFKPLFDALQSLRNDVNEKEVTPITDLTPILDKLDEKEVEDDVTRDEVVGLLNSLGENLAKIIPLQVENMLRKASFTIESTQAKMEIPQKKEEKIVFDIKHLSS